MLSRRMLVSIRTFTFVAFEPRTISGSPPSDIQVGFVFLPNCLITYDSLSQALTECMQPTRASKSVPMSILMSSTHPTYRLAFSRPQVADGNTVDAETCVGINVRDTHPLFKYSTEHHRAE
jgi:hypothetical protein